MPFSQVLGQDEAATFLRQAIAGDRVAHAYLFRGPDGVGKMRMAREFAAALLCPQRRDAQDSCGACAVCRRIFNGNHPDVAVIAAAEGKRHISMDQVRQLESSARRAAFEAAWRIFIIRDAERLAHGQNEAQNALLKTLEEPPPGRLLILVASRPDRLLPTILSRCHQLRFFPLSPEILAELMRREAPDADAADIEFAVACSGGSMSQALRLLRADARRMAEELLPRLETMRLEDVFAMALAARESAASAEKELEGKRDEARLFLDIATSYYRDVAALAAAGRDCGRLRHPRRAAEAARLAQRWGAARAARAVELLWQARDRIEQNANIRLTLDDAMLGIAALQVVALPKNT